MLRSLPSTFFTNLAYFRLSLVHQIARVEIHCDPENFRSAAIPHKLGFVHEATLRQRVEDHEGRKRDSMIWTLFAEDYPASKAANAAIVAWDVIGRKLL